MRFLIAGGGTGGHYFPALAVANSLTEKGHSVFYVGTENGIEKRLGFPAEMSILLKVSGVVGRGVKGYLSSFRFLTSTAKLLKELNRFQIDGAILFGGYASLPSGLASFLKGIPVYLQEQNSVPGRVNRFLSNFSECSFLGFPGAERLLKGKKLFTGNPLRREVVEAAEERERVKRETLKKLNLSAEKRTLLVLGGSQGALFLNRLFIDAAPFLNREVQIVHITGKSKEEEKLTEAYRDRGIDARVFTFYSKIWELYAVADGAVSRAGALAISELSLFGVPTLFIPYPYAADDHQLMNARFLSEIGAALYRRQEEITPKEAAGIVETLLFSIIESDRLRENFLSFSRPDATEKITEVVCRRRG